MKTKEEILKMSKEEMSEEFNLSEKREQMFLELCNKEPDVAWIIQVIKQETLKQDKEFIKRLKDEFCVCKNMDNEPESAYRRIQIEMNNQCKHHIIDKLAGDLK